MTKAKSYKKKTTTTTQKNKNKQKQQKKKQQKNRENFFNPRMSQLYRSVQEVYRFKYWLAHDSIQLKEGRKTRKSGTATVLLIKSFTWRRYFAVFVVVSDGNKT